MKAQSDTLLISRHTANEIAGIGKNLSYRVFPSSAFAGRITMRDFREALVKAARNGAEWDGEKLVSQEVIGCVSRRALRRIVSKAPHFRFSNKTILLNTSDLLSAVSKNK